MTVTKRTDPAFCRSLGHLPRNILRAHPTEDGATIEGCLRCGTVLVRSKEGVDQETRRYAYEGGRIVKLELA